MSGLVVDLEQRLDEELTLERLAREQGLSPFHFHRKVQRAMGETPAQLVERLRLEAAALRLAVAHVPVLSIALEFGYRSPETFARAFRRMFGHSPTAHRRLALANQQERLRRNAGFTGDGCRLSEVRFVRLPRMHLAAYRRLGAYEEFMTAPFRPEDEVWGPMFAWAQARGLGPEALAITICPDDPGVTPGPLQRLDACLPVAAPAPTEGGYRGLTFAGGWHALIEHRGPYETIGQAYRGCADGIRRCSAYAFAAGPPIEFFRTVADDPAEHVTEVGFPVRRRIRSRP
jgi:AraC family transcriptional regulator